MISDLSRMAEARKSKLSHYLNSSEEMPLERQHQVYGAIKELRTIMNVLSEHRMHEMKKEGTDEIILMKPVQDKGFLSNAKSFFNEIF